MTRRPTGFTVLTWVTGVSITVAVVVLPFLRFAYRNPSLHIALDAAEAVVAIVAAYLVFGRYRQSAYLSDLIVVYSLGVLAGTNLLLSAIPAAAFGARAETFSTWAPLIARLLGSAAFATGALPLPVLGRARSRHGLGVGVAITMTLVGVGALVLAVATALPAAVRVDGASSASPKIEGHPALVGAQLLQFAFYAVASAGFTRRAVATDDELLRWFGAAAALAAVARINYSLFPSLYSDFVYAGDGFRLAFYLFLLIGAAREVSGYWRTRMEVAVLDERRRIARDLHDGVAQELVFIGNQGRRLTARSEGKLKEDLDQLVHAAERGVGDARRAIAALSRGTSETLEEAVVEIAEELTSRAEIALHLQLQRVDVSGDTREQLLRILREAITNASRHSGATNIWVTLERSDGKELRLAITDDGSGFEPASRAGSTTGFGLASMRERAEALGADLRLRSEPGRGTTVEVVLPSPMS